MPQCGGLLRASRPRLNKSRSLFIRGKCNGHAQLKRGNVNRRGMEEKLLPIDYERCCSDRLTPPQKPDILPCGKKPAVPSNFTYWLCPLPPLESCIHQQVRPMPPCC